MVERTMPVTRESLLPFGYAVPDAKVRLRRPESPAEGAACRDPE